VIKLIYGVSPHPAQAPLNSNLGLHKDAPGTVNLFNISGFS